MLVAKIQEVSSRPGYKGNGPPFVLDLVDNKTPQGRSLSIRIPVTFDGLCAIGDAIEIIKSRRSNVATGQEKKGANKYTPIKENK